MASLYSHKLAEWRISDGVLGALEACYRIRLSANSQIWLNATSGMETGPMNKYREEGACGDLVGEWGTIFRPKSNEESADLLR
jgi:hypothetical protein